MVINSVLYPLLVKHLNFAYGFLVANMIQIGTSFCADKTFLNLLKDPSKISFRTPFKLSHVILQSAVMVRSSTVQF